MHLKPLTELTIGHVQKVNFKRCANYHSTCFMFLVSHARALYTMGKYEIFSFQYFQWC